MSYQHLNCKHGHVLGAATAPDAPDMHPGAQTQWQNQWCQANGKRHRTARTRVLHHTRFFWRARASIAASKQCTTPPCIAARTWPRLISTPWHFSTIGLHVLQTESRVPLEERPKLDVYCGLQHAAQHFTPSKSAGGAPGAGCTCIRTGLFASIRELFCIGPLKA